MAFSRSLGRTEANKFSEVSPSSERHGRRQDGRPAAGMSELTRSSQAGRACPGNIDESTVEKTNRWLLRRVWGAEERGAFVAKPAFLQHGQGPITARRPAGKAFSGHEAVSPEYTTQPRNPSTTNMAHAFGAEPFFFARRYPEYMSAYTWRA
ncbi:hypothetical protein VTK26DRAFT_7999 [Humicola hyalothermophila]